MRQHTCTDVPCCVIFLVCLAFTAWVLVSGFKHGDPRKVYYGLDYSGSLCGVDLPSQPYLYWCAKADPLTGSLQMDFAHPICVDACPSSTSTHHDCFVSDGVTRSMVDYPTHKFAGRYCFPQDHQLTSGLSKHLSGESSGKHVQAFVVAFTQAWPCLIVALIIALITGYIYLFFLKRCAGPILCVLVLVVLVLTLFFGLYLIIASYNGGVDGVPDTGDSDADFTVGMILLVLGLLFLITVCCLRSAVEKAVLCIEAACDCLFAEPTLLLEPLLNLALRVALWGTMLVGLMWVITAGKVKKEQVYRSFEYTPEQWVAIIFYVVMMIWVNDVCNALDQYVVAYATSRWYFTPYEHNVKRGVPFCAIGLGYTTAFAYHLGSLALGGFIIASVRIFRMIVAAFLEIMNQATGNCAICRCCAAIVNCCTGCFEQCLLVWTKNAYIDVAVRSTEMCVAARAAYDMMRREGMTIMMLSGATWIFQICGTCAITALSTLFIFILVKTIPAFSDSESTMYVPDVAVFLVLAGFIAFLVSLSFMLCLDMVAETTLYCFSLEKANKRAHTGFMGRATARTEGFFNTFFGGCFGHSQMPEFMDMHTHYAPPKLNQYLDNSGTQYHPVGGTMATQPQYGGNVQTGGMMHTGMHH